MLKVLRDNKKKIETRKELPISIYQKRFWIEWALDPTSSKYNESMVFKITGDLDAESLKQACRHFVFNHEVVHAVYSENGEKCFYGDFSVDGFYTYISIEKNIDTLAYIKTLLNQPFDLTKGPLVRLCLISDKSNSKEYYFVLNTYHIISDALFGEIFLFEIAYNYNQIINGKTPCSESQSHTESVKKEQSLLSNNTGCENAQAFWKSYLEDIPLNINLPLNNRNKEFKSIYFSLSEKETDIVKSIAKRNRTTLFIVLGTLYGVILSKYSNQKKVAVSYPVNMRPKEFAKVLGCYVNNVPLKFETDTVKTLDELIKETTQARKQAKKHQWYIFSDIIKDQKSIRRNEPGDYFNVGFAETNLNVEGIGLNDLQTESVDITSDISSPYQLALLYDSRGSDTVKFRLTYCSNKENGFIIDQFIDSYRKLINDSRQDELYIDKWIPLTEEEYQKIVYGWNKTEAPYPKDKTIHLLFEEQAERTPDNIALVFEDSTLSYKELNE
jgi:hypothetical protein